jgi:hypothetical protein
VVATLLVSFPGACWAGSGGSSPSEPDLDDKLGTGEGELLATCTIGGRVSPLPISTRMGCNHRRCSFFEGTLSVVSSGPPQPKCLLPSRSAQPRPAQPVWRRSPPSPSASSLGWIVSRHAYQSIPANKQK